MCLLLDEPTNHLDIQVIEWLEKRLGGMRSALLLISHDRRFLSNLSRSTVWVDRGATRTISIGFGSFEAWRDEFLAQEELERHKLARKIEREADWLRYGVTARRKRNVRRLAELQAMREAKRNAKRAPGQAKLEAVDGPLSGKLVIEAKGNLEGVRRQDHHRQIQHPRSSRRPRRHGWPERRGQDHAFEHADRQA